MRDGGSQQWFRYAQGVVLGSDQGEAYNAIAADLVERLWEGFSCTLVAYGQTGSGKTFTMFGPPGALTEAAVEAHGGTSPGGIPPAWGILPRVMLQLLSEANRSNDIKVTASAVEIYQEHAFDLLANRAPLSVSSTSNSRKDMVVTSTVTAGHFTGNIHPSGCNCRQCYMTRLKSKEKSQEAGKPNSTESRNSKPWKQSPIQQKKSTVSEGASGGSFATVGEAMADVTDPASVARFARLIEQTRVAKSHKLNDRSSRSHCLVRLHVTKMDGNGKVKKLQFLFVDLAGSERILKSGVNGMAEKEAIIINKSLTTLQRVIQALGAGDEFVPYRDSTLTMLLRSSFGGSSFTRAIINIADGGAHVDESIASLHFGSRIAMVRNTATVVTGTSASSESAEIEAVLQELRVRLESLESAGLAGGIGPRVPPSEAKTLLDNMHRHKEHEEAAATLQAQFTEAMGRGKAAGTDTYDELHRRLQAARAEASNLRDIILRQKSIKGLWVEPSSAYTKTAAQIRELEGQLRTLRSAS